MHKQLLFVHLELFWFVHQLKNWAKLCMLNVQIYFGQKEQGWPILSSLDNGQGIGTVCVFWIESEKDEFVQQNLFVQIESTYIPLFCDISKNGNS